MATIKLVQEEEAQGKVLELYTDIKETLGITFVPNIFKAMGASPDLLEANWKRFKAVMSPGELSAREKEIIALAVSATNNCHYCINAHTASLKIRYGLSDRAVLELLAVVELFSGFNKFADGARVESDFKP